MVILHLQLHTITTIPNTYTTFWTKLLLRGHPQLSTHKANKAEWGIQTQASVIWSMDTFFVSLPQRQKTIKYCYCSMDPILLPAILGSTLIPNVSQYLREGTITITMCLTPRSSFSRDFSAFGLWQSSSFASWIKGADLVGYRCVRTVLHGQHISQDKS